MDWPTLIIIALIALLIKQRQSRREETEDEWRARMYASDPDYRGRT